MKSSLSILTNLVFLLSSISSIAQKRYVFDYKIDYSSEESIDKKNGDNEYWRLINSKDNSYQLHLRKKNKNHYFFEIIDLNGLIVRLKMKKKIFNSIKGYQIDCKSVSSYKSNFHHVPERYEFVMRADTVLDNIEHYVYDFTHQKGKGGELEGNYFRYFVNKTDTINSMPMLDNWEAYNLYNSYNIPSGIYTRKIFVKHDKTVIMLTIPRISEINIFFRVPKECDYTGS